MKAGGEERGQRSLVEGVKHAEGRCGGFCFGGQVPDGVTAVAPLPVGTVFPNGATSALLLTFDVEGTYGNGVGDMAREVANYRRICARLQAAGITATFSIVARMAEEQGPAFVRWILDAGCEVASHGTVHELNQLYGGDRIYAGHYGPAENRRQVADSIAVFDRISKGCVRGFRFPYGHFNEFSYDAIEAAGLAWASHVGIDDFIVPGQGFGGAPFQIQLADKRYPIVEIPLDTQTYDWPIWMADEVANSALVRAVGAYCRSRSLPFIRTPAGSLRIWNQRVREAVDAHTVFTLLCHPINLAVASDRWGDPVEEFIVPVIDRLGELNRTRAAWVCTCAQMADFYRSRQP
jgi:peptidoglycan/xylan/chitin deacetylase (PgdA/CDA1 family)